MNGASSRGGRWRLSRSGELTYRSSDGRGETVLVRAEPLAAGPGALVVSIDQSQKGGRVLARTLRLEGRWSVDARNRLIFGVARGRGPMDALTFEGGWELDRAHRLVFRRKLTARRRPTAETSLTFDGEWDIPGPGVLAYRFESGETFSFRGSFQSPSILAKTGEVRWQFGAGAARGRRSSALIFFGKWKLGHDLELNFELERGRGRTLRFGVAYSVGQGDEISLALTDRRGERLGAELLLTKDFLRRDGQAFLRLRRDAEEALVEAGAALRW